MTQLDSITAIENSGNVPTLSVLTMSSLEIAGLMNKRHQDVLRDARRMFERLGEPFAQFCAKVPSAGGRPTEIMNLPKRECLILVSGYSVELRARIIDRWMELEAAIGNAVRADLDGVVTGLDPAVSRQIGGIVKAIVHKELAEAIGAVLPAMVEKALLEGGHLVTREYRPALSILVDRKVPSRRRRAFAQKVSSRLRRYSAANGHPVRLSAETDRYMFHVDAISAWLRDEGERLIADHTAAIAGQGVLPFKRPR